MAGSADAPPTRKGHGFEVSEEEDYLYIMTDGALFSSEFFSLSPS